MFISITTKSNTEKKKRLILRPTDKQTDNFVCGDLNCKVQKKMDFNYCLEYFQLKKKNGKRQ